MSAPKNRPRRDERVRAIDIAGRTPPHDENCERATLASVLYDHRCFDAVAAEIPSAEAFYCDANRRIYEAMGEAHRAGQTIDMHTLASALQRADRLIAVGGLTYLSSLVGTVASAANAAAYAREVRDCWRLRRGIEAAQMIAADGYEYAREGSQAYLDSAVDQLATIAQAWSDRQEPVQAYDLITERIRSYGEDPVDGVTTGLVDVDAVTGGVRDDELIIVGGRPGMAKTAYAVSMAVHVARAPQNEVKLGAMVFSLEMPKRQIADRMICTEGKVDLSAWRKKAVDGRTLERAHLAAAELSQMPLWVDDTPAIGVAEIRAKVRTRQASFNRKHGDRWLQRIGLVVIDYLQLMRGSPDAQSREQEISSISRELKAMSKELHVPVVALSQLNRAVETRSTKDKRPQLSDLRESGAIEQDADMIQFLYRPEYYIADKESAEARRVKGYAEVIVAKQRNGPTRRVPVTFIDNCTRFENRAADAWSDSSDE